MKFTNIVETKNEDALFEDIVREVIASEPSPLPPARQVFGSVVTNWHECEPGIAHIAVEGGTTDDRLLAHSVVRAQLEGHGYRHAQYTFDWDLSKTAMVREATWDDIMQKSKRLLQSGQVQLLRNGENNVVAQVQGDHGNYQCEFSRDDPNSKAITGWQCQCPWDQFAFQRCVILGTMITLASGEEVPVEEIRPGNRVIDHLGYIGIVSDVHFEDWDKSAIHLHTTGFSPLITKPIHPILAIKAKDITCQNKDGSLLKRGGKRGPLYTLCHPGCGCRHPRLAIPEPKFYLAEQLEAGDYLIRPHLNGIRGQTQIDLAEYVGPQTIIGDTKIIPTREMTTRWGKRMTAKQRKGTIPRFVDVDQYLMKLIGYYLAEGGVANYSVRFAFNRSEKEYLDEVESLAFQLFGNRAKREGTTANCQVVSMNNREIANVFKEWIGTGHTSKIIPEWIMTLDPLLQGALIEGWHNGDGHIRLSDGRYELTTVSRTLAHQAEILLQRQGYTVSRIHERRSERDNGKNEQDAYKLYWIPNRKHEGGKRLNVGDYTLVRIVSAKEIPYTGKMIDLTIEGNPGFVAEGFSVHNTRQWKKYEGRPCAHLLAAYWKSLGTPTDEQLEQQQQGNQQSLFNIPPGQTPPSSGPGGFGSPPNAMPSQQLPIPGIAPGTAQGTPPMPGDLPPGNEILPQFPMDPALQPPLPPSQIPGGLGVSVPGLRQPSPANPTQYPNGTFSSVQGWDFGDGSDTMMVVSSEWTNGQIVSLRHDDVGTAVGRSEAHGAGQSMTVPAGSVGEVLGADPTTGMVNVYYTGPCKNNGPMEPHGVTAWHWPSDVIPRPDIRPPGPAVRRRSHEEDDC